MLNPQQPLHLQICGRHCDGTAQQGPPQALGPRVFLQSGSLRDEEDGLGQINRTAIPLPAALTDGRWLVEAFQLWTLPTGGELLLELPLVDQLLLNRPALQFLPPGAIQLAQQRQPLWCHWPQERNPAPGWEQRVHLYQLPGKPFQATAVLYLDGLQRIVAAELFDMPIRLSRGQIEPARRIWVQFSAYSDT